MSRNQFDTLLSRREREVVDLLLQGKSNKQIALSLGISERTVEFHLRNIYAKTHMASRVELILKLEETGGDFKKPVESTVEITDEIVDNGSQPARTQAAQAWRNLVVLIRKEAAMTFKISFEDLENYLRNHTVLLSLSVLFGTSLILRYIFFDLGLYFWGSYLLLEVLLLLASVRFGESLNGTIPFHPLMTLSTAVVFPFIAVGLDQLYLNTILRYTGASSVSLPYLCTSAEWLTSPDGISYLATNLSTTSDAIWFVAIAGMSVTFLLSRIFGKHSGNNTLVTA